MSAFPHQVIIRNAREHNLKGITVELPRRALTVITGPSGSGKSSLAFDTLYAEGQRRYIESLSTYAKQFLERMPKPLVDSIDGISPAVAIEQKNPTTTSRSTVGTATEIYDFLRLLWARVGTPYCVKCGREVKADTVQEVVDALIAECGVRSAEFEGADHSAFRTPNSALVVAFPLPPTAHRPDVEVAAQLRAAGFVRAQVDGALVRLDTPEAEQRVREGAEVLVVVDRVAAADASRGRLTDAVATAFSEGEGVAVTLDNGDRRRFSEHPTCSSCGTPAPALAPSLFSFNTPRGACPACNGFGAVLEYDESLIVPDARRTLAQGALDPGRNRATRGGADCCARSRGPRGSPPTRRGATCWSATAASCCTARPGATSGCSRFSNGSRRSATSSTSACSCGSTSSPRPARPAAARGSSPRRWRYGSVVRASRRRRRSRRASSPPGSRPSRCRPSRARSPCTSSRSSGRGSPSSTTWGWDI